MSTPFFSSAVLHFCGIFGKLTTVDSVKLLKLLMMNRLNYKWTGAFLLAGALLFSALQAQAAVGESFKLGVLQYTILTENETGGTVSVERNGQLSGDIKIPKVVKKGAIKYNVTELRPFAFFEAGGLTSVTVPEGVTTIGERAFYSCKGLTKVTLPATLTKMGDSVFYKRLALKEISVAPECKAFHSEAGVLFDKEMTLLIVYPPGKEDEEYRIPDTVKVIADRALSDCRNLVNVHVGNNLNKVGESAFEHCNKLANIEIPDGITEIGHRAFSYCESLKNVKIGNNVTKIGASAFKGCKSLVSVTIGNSVTEIGYFAFSWCSNLTHVYYNWDVPEAEYDIYAGDPETLISYYPEENDTWEAATVGDQWQDRGAASWDPKDKEKKDSE